MNGFPEKLEPVNDPRRQDIDLAALFGPAEHGLYAYYGRLGQGKTYAMTADIIEDLKRGGVWYVNYPIHWEGYDERNNKMQLFLGFLGIRRKYYEFKHVNLHYIKVDETFHDKVETLTDCKIALDEGYVAYDSYEMAKLSMQKRQTILHARHYDRSFYYTVQRPTSIHVTLRANTNVFYKVTKFQIFHWVLFKREEFDLGKDEHVDEDNRLSLKFYLGKAEIFQAYDTKYLRGTIPPSQELHVEIHKPSYGEILVRLLGRFGKGQMPLQRPAPAPKPSTFPSYIEGRNKQWDIIKKKVRPLT